MSLRFMDSFDHYAQADLAKKWTTVNGTIGTNLFITSGGRHGSNCLKITAQANTANVRKTFDNQASWSVSFALKVDGVMNTDFRCVTLLDATTLQCSMCVRSNGAVSVANGAGPTPLTGGSSVAGVIREGVWHWVEWKATISNSIAANSCQVQVDGSTVVNVTTGQSTRVSANNTANIVQIGGTSTTATYIDDVVICDGATNEFGATFGPILDTHVDSLAVTADGTTNDWTASAGGRSACVNEVSMNNDTNYVSAAVAGNVQLFNFTDLPYNMRWCNGIQLNNFARTDSASTYLLYPVIRSNNTTNVRTASLITPTSAYVDYTNVMDLDPCNSNAAWTKASIDAIEGGIKLNSVT